MGSLIDENVSETTLIVGSKSAAERQPVDAITATRHGRTTTKSKKDQLLALISKPAGTRISILSERLGWQAHTVRAALSGLRKQGHVILATKAAKTREAVYIRVLSANVDAEASQGTMQ